MPEEIKADQVVSDPDGRVTGQVLAVFDAGDIGQVATVAWRHSTGAYRVQYNVGVGWLTVREGIHPDPQAALAAGTCTVCGTSFLETGTTPDQYGTCGYGQCMEAAWPQCAYVPQPNEAEKPVS